MTAQETLTVTGRCDSLFFADKIELSAAVMIVTQDIQNLLVSDASVDKLK